MCMRALECRYYRRNTTITGCTGDKGHNSMDSGSDCSVCRCMREISWALILYIMSTVAVVFG